MIEPPFSPTALLAPAEVICCYNDVFPMRTLAQGFEPAIPAYGAAALETSQPLAVHRMSSYRLGTAKLKVPLK